MTGNVMQGKELPPPARVLTAVTRVARAIRAGSDLDAVFDTAATELAELTPYDRCTIGLMQADGESFRIIALRGAANAQPRANEQPIRASVAEYVVKGNQSIIYDVTEEDRFNDDDGG